MFDFENLTVYKRAKVFNHENFTFLTKTEKLDTASRNQLRRASLSVVLNIAEGSSRFSKRDRRNFYVIARGSLFECIVVLDVLKDEGVVTDSFYTACYQKADELSRMLFALIRNLES